MFIDQQGELGVAHLFPAVKAYVLPLTRRGVFAEFSTLLNAYAFALYKDRHLFAEVDRMDVDWDALFEHRPQSAAGLDQSAYPARSLISVKAGARAHFEDMRQALAHANAAPRIKLPQIGFKGTLEQLTAKLAQAAFKPRLAIQKSAKARMAALEITDQTFYAVHIPGGDPDDGARRDHAAFMGPILAEDPAPTIFVLTDDHREVTALRAAYPQARIVTLCPPDSAGYLQSAEAAKDLQQRTADAARLLEDVLIANRAKGFFGPYRSDLSRFMHLLRFPRPSSSIDGETSWSPFPTARPAEARRDATAPAMARLGRDGAIEVATTAKKHILELGAYVRCVAPAAAKDPDILLLSAAVFDPDTWRRDVPDHLWARAAAGTMRVVFDASSEGREHHEDISRRLHKFVTLQGVPGPSVVYLTQDRGYGADYKAWLESRRRKDGFKILYADYFVRKFFSGVEERGAETFELRLQRFRSRTATRERRFISLNNKPRESKLYFLARLLRDGLWPCGFISYGGLGAHTDGKLPAYRTWRHEMAELAPWLERLESLGGTMIGDVGARAEPGFRVPVMDVDMPEHDRSWFSVITETEMRPRPSRITEKPLKALVNFHPFVFLGNPGSLQQLKALGFQSVPGFFDETYDEILDPRARFEHVYDQIAALCAADEATLLRRSEAVNEGLIHNAWWGLTQAPALYREKKDLDLLSAILS